jgi:hypothetical protein
MYIDFETSSSAEQLEEEVMGGGRRAGRSEVVAGVRVTPAIAYPVSSLRGKAVQERLERYGSPNASS